MPERYGADALQSIPVQRVLDKLDVLLSKKDFGAAEEHLLYWLSEAERGHDLRGQLTLCNELIGHYRKAGLQNEALQFADRAVELIRLTEMEDSITAGTTCVNAATAYHAFGREETSLQLF